MSICGVGVVVGVGDAESNNVISSDNIAPLLTDKQTSRQTNKQTNKQECNKCMRSKSGLDEVMFSATLEE